jgi:4-carboxymuconolactone decarboxylase
MTKRAASTREAIWGDKAEAIEKGLNDTDPDLARLIIDVAYEGVFARPGLDLRTRELLAIVMLMSVGSETELKTHMHGALNCGATRDEIRETVLQAAMYLGFPKALAAMKVLAKLKASP